MSGQDWHADDQDTVAFYTARLREFGGDVRALNWGSTESQARRFCVLAGIGDLEGRTVLDVGCGLGDLLGWLRGRGTRVDYLGLDVTEDMVTRARARYPDARFAVGSLLDDAEGRLGTFDYVFASGIFYLRKHAPQAFLEQTVERMYACCRRGVAFNSLSAWADRREADEFQADPLATLAACRRLTPWVALRHDYHPGDFTIYLHRRAAA